MAGRRFNNVRVGLAAFLLLLAVACQKKLPHGVVEEFGFSAIVFVSRPAPSNAGSLTAPDEPRSGGNLFLLKPAAPGGKLIGLTRLQEGDVLGVDVATNGKSLVASVKTGPHDRFHLIAMDVDQLEDGKPCFTDNGDLGPACSRLTFGPADDTRPFTLPDGRIGFLREDPDGPVDVHSRGRSRTLMAVEPDGTGLTRLDMGPGHTLGPGAVRDGWVYLIRATGREGQSVFVPLRLDSVGARGVELQGSSRLSDVPLGPRQLALAPYPCANITDQQECDEQPGCSAENTPEGFECRTSEQAGRLYAACVAPSGTWGAGTVCEPGQDGVWEGVVASIPEGGGCSPEGRVRDPVPLADGRFLVSYAKVPEGCMNTQDGDQQNLPDFGVAVLDPHSGTRLPVFNRPGDEDLFPRPLQARALLDDGVGIPARPGGCDHQELLFEGFIGDDWIARGAARIRVVELLTGAQAPWRMELGGGEVRAICASGGVQQAPIYADGSFRLRAPKGLPVKLQLLDRYGAVLGRENQDLSFTPAVDPLWRGGPACAVRRCAACHQNSGTAEGFESSLAAAQEPSPLDGPADDRTDYDFRRDIQPILDRSCVAAGCHDQDTAAGSYVTLEGNLRGLVLSGEASGRSTLSYQNLLFVDRLRHSTSGRVLDQRRAYVVPGRAFESRLTQRLGLPCLFDCTDPADWAPWGLGRDQAHPEDKGGALEATDRLRIVEWIDAGAPFCGRGCSP